MAFNDIRDAEGVLDSPGVSIRDLHGLWEQREPVPDPGGQKGHGPDIGNVRQIQWIQEGIGLASRFTLRALEKEEFLLVCDAAREILRYWERATAERPVELLRVRMRYATALARLGDVSDARNLLAPCAAPDYRPRLGRELLTEILLQLGDIQREEAHRAADRASRVQAIETALGFYRRALDLQPTSLEALMWVAATTLYGAGEGAARRDQALDFARQLLDLAAAREDSEGPRFTTTRARAEACALLGRIDEASAMYERLREAEDKSISALAEARYRSRFLADALDRPRDFLYGAFPRLQLVVFTGHMPDLPGHAPRFPAARIGEVREKLRVKLAALDAEIGMASAAAGADLLFLDELRRRPGSRLHVVLPWSEAEFRNTSVRRHDHDPANPLWEPLFDRALAAAASVRELGEFYPPDESSGPVGWEYTGEVTAGLALHTARVLRLDVQPLALWDGQPGRGPGGTASFVGFWRRRLGAAPEIIHPTPPDQRAQSDDPGVTRRVEQATLHQVVKTLLFADIVGYSRLRERAIPGFVTSFLERVSQLAATSQYAPQSVNTWGDAVYAVFDFARDAGNFALELTAMIHDNEDEWLNNELYWEEPAVGDRPATKHPLNIRVGLHTGPVFQHYDPVVRRVGYTGAHVSRAARIEPVTQPGFVFASEEFAAFAELDAAIRHRGDTADDDTVGFVCEYAGSMALAKGYPGRYRIYRLMPTRRLDIEALARAIHELYCEEQRKLGNTIETNTMLCPWDELTENMREANREQAADIPHKLRMLGYELVHHRGIRAVDMQFDGERVEAVARYEHERWMNERQRAGWTYGAKRDNALKKQPLLVPWEQLPETEKQKDRDTVVNLPALIDKAGFRVRRMDPGG